MSDITRIIKEMLEADPTVGRSRVAKRLKEEGVEFQDSELRTTLSELKSNRPQEEQESYSESSSQDGETPAPINHITEEITPPSSKPAKKAGKRAIPAEASTEIEGVLYRITRQAGSGTIHVFTSGTRSAEEKKLVPSKPNLIIVANHHQIEVNPNDNTRSLGVRVLKALNQPT